MQLLPYITLLATALAGESFHALIIRSGSQYQYKSFDTSGDDIIAGSGGNFKLILNSDTTLIDPESQKYLNINNDKSVTLKDTPQTGYSLKEGYLARDDSSAFEVCAGYRIKFDANEDDSCTGVAVSVRNQEKVDDLHRSEPAKTSENKPEATSESKPESASTAATSEGTMQKFGLIAIHSGSSVQNAAIKKVPEHPHVFSVGGSEGADLTLILDTKTKILMDQDNRGIFLDDKTGELGDVPPFGRHPATTGFTVEDGHLNYNGNSDWNACPSGNGFSLSKKECVGGISIALHAVNL